MVCRKLVNQDLAEYYRIQMELLNKRGGMGLMGQRREIAIIIILVMLNFLTIMNGKME